MLEFIAAGDELLHIGWSGTAAGPPNTRPTDSSSNLCWALMRLVVQQSPELKLGRRPTPYCSRTTKMTLSGLARAHVSPALGLMVGKIGFSYQPIQAFPTRQGCAPELYELVATFISL